MEILPFLTFLQRHVVLDDGTFAGTRSAVVKLFCKHGPSSGLTLNLKKCDIFWHSGDSAFPDFPPEVCHPGGHLEDDWVVVVHGTVSAPDDSGQEDSDSADKQPSQGCYPVKLASPMDSVVDEPIIDDTTHTMYVSIRNHFYIVCSSEGV